MKLEDSLFPCGVIAEKRCDSNGELEVRLRDSLGFSAWSAGTGPVYLDRQAPGKRYLWLPPAPDISDECGRLVVVGHVFPPDFNDETVMPFSEDWRYIDIEYFSEGMEWETVKKGEHVCHRLVQDGRFGEWAYLSDPATFVPAESEISYMVLPEGSCGNGPARNLMEVLSLQTGIACLKDEELGGYLYLVSSPKDTSSLQPVVAECTLGKGILKNLVLLMGGTSSYSRFPDLGETLVGVHLWGHLGDVDPHWPCTHLVWNPESRHWEDFSNLARLRAFVSTQPCSHSQVKHDYDEPLEGWIY